MELTKLLITFKEVELAFVLGKSGNGNLTLGFFSYANIKQGQLLG